MVHLFITMVKGVGGGTIYLKGDFINMSLGHHNDARMNVALALTAVYHGATVLNHCEVISLLKDENGVNCGAKVRDTFTGEEWQVKAKVIIL